MALGKEKRSVCLTFQEERRPQRARDEALADGAGGGEHRKIREERSAGLSPEHHMAEFVWDCNRTVAYLQEPPFDVLFAP